MSAPIVNQDILDLGEGHIVCHQCNCVTSNAAGLALELFEKYPLANVYRRYHRVGLKSSPGTIGIFRCGPTIVNMHAQCNPGGPSEMETCNQREQWFASCLDLLEKFLRTNYPPGGRKAEVAFPYFIGCGLGGGSWDNHYAMIRAFADRVADCANVRVCKK